MRHRYSTCALIVVVFCSLATLAHAKPNFTGEWTINLEKSDFGQLPAPYKFVRKIEHNEPNLKIVTDQSGERGEFTTVTTYTTDGKECINVVRGSEVKSTAEWDGDTLVINGTMDRQGLEITYQEKMALSEDGKTQIVTAHFSSEMGEADITIALDKK
jgi:hypothetical protein